MKDSKNRYKKYAISNKRSLYLLIKKYKERVYSKLKQ